MIYIFIAVTTDIHLSPGTSLLLWSLYWLYRCVWPASRFFLAYLPTGTEPPSQLSVAHRSTKLWIVDFLCQSLPLWIRITLSTRYDDTSCPGARKFLSRKEPGSDRKSNPDTLVMALLCIAADATIRHRKAPGWNWGVHSRKQLYFAVIVC